jgi:drug/metabolite transporter (DMT)-like permease
MGTVLALAAALVVAGTGALWLRRIRQVSIPRDRSAYLLLMGGGASLGLAALTAAPGWLGAIAAGFAVLGGGVFCGLRALSRQAAKLPAVAVGGPILEFTLPDETGAPFDLAGLRGRPFLLKFFRGHW